MLVTFEPLQVSRMGVPQENKSMQACQIMTCAADYSVLFWDTRPQKDPANSTSPPKTRNLINRWWVFPQHSNIWTCLGSPCWRYKQTLPGKIWGYYREDKYMYFQIFKIYCKQVQDRAVIPTFQRSCAINVVWSIDYWCYGCMWFRSISTSQSLGETMPLSNSPFRKRTVTDELVSKQNKQIAGLHHSLYHRQDLQKHLSNESKILVLS